MVRSTGSTASLTGLEALVVSEAKQDLQFRMFYHVHACHTTVSDVCGKHSSDFELVDMPSKEVTAIPWHSWVEEGHPWGRVQPPLRLANVPPVRTSGRRVFTGVVGEADLLQV